MQYDLLIPVSPKDFDILPYCLRGVHFFSPPPEELFIVCPLREPVIEIAKKVGVPVTVVTDRELFDFVGEGRKPVWFQQIIKMFQTVTRDDYMSWDVDLILRKKFDVFGIDNRPIMRYHKSPTANLNESYNAYMREVFGQQPSIHMTMICHHMFFHRAVWKEIIGCFLALHPKPDGRSDVRWFYDWLLENGYGLKHEESVAETEIYAHYVLEKHPTAYEIQMAGLIDFISYDTTRNLNTFDTVFAQHTEVSMIAFHKRVPSLNCVWCGCVKS